MLAAVVRRSLAHPGVVVALAVLLLVLGGLALSHADYDLFPEFVPPQLTIETESPGLAPRQVEALVTRPLEAAVSGVLGVRAVRSESVQGLSKIQLVFGSGADLYHRRQLVSEKLAGISGQLPAGVGTPTMLPLTSSTMVIESIGFTSATLSPRALQDFVRWTVLPRLLAVPGIADINLWGGEARQLQVQVRPSRLAMLDLTLQDVMAATQAATGMRGAGWVDTPIQRFTLESDGQALTPQQLGDAVVRTHAGTPPLLLRDVARIRFGDAPRFGDALVMGRPGVVIALNSQCGADTLTTTRSVNAALTELTALARERGVTIYPKLYEPARYLETALHSLANSLLLGILLVAIVLMIFLREWRAALISFISIPLSLLAAVIALRYFGQSLNTMTLGGLAVAVGVVVDDAVIDVENILRRIREHSPSAAQRVATVFRASLEVRTPILFATLVVLMVFLPILHLHGLQGSFFAPLALAVVFAILASLVVALTVTPALCLLLLTGGAHKPEPRFLFWLKRHQTRFLRRLSPHPRPLLVGALLAGIGACLVLPLFGGELLPTFREGDFVATMTAPPGTSIDVMQKLSARLSQQMLAIPGVARDYVTIGRAAGGVDTYPPNKAEFNVELTPAGAQDSADIQHQLNALLGAQPGLQYQVTTFLGDRINDSLTGEAAPVVISVFGQDLYAIDQAVHAVADALRNVPGAAQVRVKAPPSQPQLNIRLRRKRLAGYGLRVDDVLSAIETAFQGTTVAHVYAGTRLIPVTVTVDPALKRDPQRVGTLLLRGASGALVPLDKVADVDLGEGRSEILHEGGIRRQVITSNPTTTDLTTFVARAKAVIASQVKLPPGVYLHFGGTAEAQAAAHRDLAINAAVALAGIVILLFLAFGDARRVLLVLLCIPFALVGGVAALALTGGIASIGVWVGFVALFGIAARNAILLLAHYGQLVVDERQPWNLETALRGARERFTPVLMTALLTALGLLPVALHSGHAGQEIEGPMAIVLLGGVVSSTILSLLLLPGMALRWLQFESVPRSDVAS